MGLDHEAIRKAYSEVVMIDDDAGAFDDPPYDGWFE